MPFWSASSLALGPGATLSLAGGGLLAVSLVIVAITVAIAAAGARFRRRALRTTGTIVGRTVSRSRDGDSGPVYYSIVEFAAEGGALTRGRSRVASNPPAGKIGAEVPIYYDPANPSRVSIDNGRTRVMNGCAIAVASIIAGGFLLFGIIMLEIGLHVH